MLDLPRQLSREEMEAMLEKLIALTVEYEVQCMLYGDPQAQEPIGFMNAPRGLSSIAKAKQAIDEGPGWKEMNHEK